MCIVYLCLIDFKFIHVISFVLYYMSPSDMNTNLINHSLKSRVYVNIFSKYSAWLWNIPILRYYEVHSIIKYILISHI